MERRCKFQERDGNKRAFPDQKFNQTVEVLRNSEGDETRGARGTDRRMLKSTEVTQSGSHPVGYCKLSILRRGTENSPVVSEEESHERNNANNNIRTLQNENRKIKC